MKMFFKTIQVGTPCMNRTAALVALLFIWAFIGAGQTVGQDTELAGTVFDPNHAAVDGA